MVIIITAGYTPTRPSDYGELYSLAKIGAAALEKVHDTEYLIGTIPDLLYTSAGSHFFHSIPLIYLFIYTLDKKVDSLTWRFVSFYSCLFEEQSIQTCSCYNKNKGGPCFHVIQLWYRRDRIETSISEISYAHFNELYLELVLRKRPFVLVVCQLASPVECLTTACIRHLTFLHDNVSLSCSLLPINVLNNDSHWFHLNYFPKSCAKKLWTRDNSQKKKKAQVPLANKEDERQIQITLNQFQFKKEKTVIEESTATTIINELENQRPSRSDRLISDCRFWNGWIQEL